MPIRKHWAIYSWLFTALWTTATTATTFTWGLSVTIALILWSVCGLLVAFGVVLATPLGTTVVLWLQEVSPVKIKIGTLNMLQEVSATLSRIRYKEMGLLDNYIQSGQAVGEVSIRNRGFECFKDKHIKREKYNLSRLIGSIGDSVLNKAIGDEEARRSHVQSLTIDKDNPYLSLEEKSELEILLGKLEKGRREFAKIVDERIEELKHIYERNS